MSFLRRPVGADLKHPPFCGLDLRQACKKQESRGKRRISVLVLFIGLASPAPALAGRLFCCLFACCCAVLPCFASTADLKLEIQAPPWDQPQPLWQRLTYTILVSNAGPDTATRVVVTNAVPEQLGELEITVSQGTWTLTNRALRCQLGDLVSGGAAAVAVQATPTNVGGVFLEAGVTSFNFDPTWPNTIYTQFELGVAQVELWAEVKTNRVSAGVPFALSVTVTNLGPDPAEYVPLYRDGAWTQRCTPFECRYWPDFLGAGFSLSQGTVVEFHDNSLPWHVSLGTIQPLGFAILDLSLIATHTGELPFAYSARKNVRDTNYGSISISVSGGPGIIEFSGPQTNFWENAGAAVLEVLRHDGAEGTVQVSFSTHDGNALAGIDY